MFYKVTARFKKETAAALWRKLTDGSVARQRPDGPEIVAAMQRAVVTESGAIEWSEVCYCRSPLDHERATVYDHHFDGIATEVVDGYQEHAGRPFMEYLEDLS